LSPWPWFEFTPRQSLVTASAMVTEDDAARESHPILEPWVLEEEKEPHIPHGEEFLDAAANDRKVVMRRGLAVLVFTSAAIILAVLRGTGSGRKVVSTQLDFMSAASQVGPLPPLTVVPYGVLGVQLQTSGTMTHNGEDPGSEIAVVDPAGLQFIQDFGPGGAGGASGAIYKWLGIDQANKFPSDVRKAIRATGGAKFHSYGPHMAIHVVGPNLAELGAAGPVSEGVAIDQLAQAYTNVLSEFLVASVKGVKVLRLLPISGGIFAGDFLEDLPRLTFTALAHGFSKLPAASQTKLTSSGLRLEMCIFEESDLQKFQAAYSAAKQA